MDQASGSSSSHFRQWSFDVFLSFRGEDTRSNFTSHLNMALCQRGINVFIDNKLSRGEEVSASISKAIEESKISIVIISENYASSSWCLNELVKIIMCNKCSEQVVLPVFYKVDPSEVRKQHGAFGEAFAKLEVRFLNKMQAWREALTTISHMSGWVLGKDDEANLIQKIAQEVWKKLNRTMSQLHVAKYPVGVDIQVMNLLFHVMSDEITMVGIYGLGGMGKTTLAKALYNKIVHNFEGCCFLANIREASKQCGGLAQLQEKLLFEILMDDLIKVSNLHRGVNIIRDRLCSKKILLILDDIDKSEQLQALAGGHDWFGPGSKVIATTRNKHLLSIHGFDILQSVCGLNHNEALELFSWHAFKNSHPPSDYLDLSKRVVHYCKGLPLALEVLGSFLYSTDQSKFKSILDEYENSYLDKDIQDLLQISYDGLEDDVKEIFLYISCFFVGEDIDNVKMMLEACGSLCLEKGITKLMNLSLLTIDIFNKVEMHELIQQMGRTIALSETSKSQKRKKFLIEDDAMDVLSGNKEARAVKAMKLDFPQSTELDIDSRAFEKVKNLVVLKVHNATFSKSLDYLPSSLRWMSWSGFPFSYLPSSYTMKNLIQLKLPYSSIKHFGKGFLVFMSILVLISMSTYFKFDSIFFYAMQSCELLKHLDLRGSKFLKEIPDLSVALNLEELDLAGCSNLTKVHESVGSLGKLVKLHLFDNHNLTQFPSYLKLKSLKYLSIRCCFELEHSPHFDEEMKSLERIHFDESGIRELPLSIGYLNGLKDLDLRRCTDLTTLPSTIYRLSNLTSLSASHTGLSTFPSLFPCSPSLFPNLTELHLRECNIKNLSFLETIFHVAPLRELDLSQNDFSSLPSCIVNFTSLRFLEIEKCKLLEEIPKVPEGIIFMNAGGCISLARFPNNLADMISCDSEHVDGDFKQLLLMNCDIPEWYSYKSMNNQITFFMPHNPGRKLKAFAPCVTFQVSYLDWQHWVKLECKVSINDIQVWSSEEVSILETLRTVILEVSPYEYMWLIVLNPNRDFYPNCINKDGNWNDIMEKSEIDLHQRCFFINSMELDSNEDDWNYITGSIWKKYTVSFEVNDQYKDAIVNIRRCGVHVIMEE